MTQLQDTKPETLFVLGRQSNLGIAELESLYPDRHIRLFNDKIAYSESPIESDSMNRLGGTVKIAQVITEAELNNWQEIEHHIKENLIDILVNIPEGKID